MFIYTRSASSSMGDRNVFLWKSGYISIKQFWWWLAYVLVHAEKDEVMIPKLFIFLFSLFVLHFRNTQVSLAQTSTMIERSLLLLWGFLVVPSFLSNPPLPVSHAAAAQWNNSPSPSLSISGVFLSKTCRKTYENLSMPLDRTHSCC